MTSYHFLTFPLFPSHRITSRNIISSAKAGRRNNNVHSTLFLTNVWMLPPIGSPAASFYQTRIWWRGCQVLFCFQIFGVSSKIIKYTITKHLNTYYLFSTVLVTETQWWTTETQFWPHVENTEEIKNKNNGIIIVMPGRGEMSII